MEDIILMAEQSIVEQTAKLMVHLQQRYDFSLTRYPKEAYNLETSGALGENMARITILEMKQCTRFPLSYVESMVRRIRMRYGSYLTSGEFRQAVKMYSRTWSLQEARRRRLDKEQTEWLVFSIDYWTNLLLSPIGLLETGSMLTLKDQRYPLRFAKFENPEIEERCFAEFYWRLPHFVGILDWVDTSTAHQIVDMLPEAVVPPHWYHQDIYGGDSTDHDVVLYEMLCDKYPTLEEKHRMVIQDGFVDSINVAEFEGRISPDNPYRLLVATISYEDTEGGDVYLALKTPYMCKTRLLVGQEVDDGLGPCVVRQVYHAYAQALWEETGNFVDIDEVIEQLEDGVELEEIL